MQSAFCGAGVECLSIGVGDDEIDALNLCGDHVGNGVSARPADTNYTDARPKFVHFGCHEFNAHFAVSPSDAKGEAPALLTLCLN